MLATGKIRPRTICKICPKLKKPIEIPKANEPLTGKEENDEEFEEDKEEILQEEEYEKWEEPCLYIDGYGDFDLVTTDQTLKEVLPPKRKKKPAFFASCSEKMRYENMIPCDVTNDHQYKASCQKNPLDQMSMLRVTSDPRWTRLPAIVATIGPSCMTEEEILELMLSGMNVARVNLAHGDRCYHLAAIRSIRNAEKNFTARIGFRIPIAIMLDLKGPLIVTGRIARAYVRDCDNPRMFLEKGKQLLLTSDKYLADKCTPSLVYINYGSLDKYVRPGMKIFLDDGAIKLMVTKTEGGQVFCTVDEEGYLGNNRKVHLPMIPMAFPPYTPADVEDILLAIDEEVDAITMPRVTNPRAIEDVRDKLTEKLIASRQMRERPIMVFAKITNFEGLRNIDAIIAAADGIVIQRGDLGLDLPPEKVFIAQKEITAKCNIAGKPVICSTHLVPSMLDKVQVSRSDVAAIASCINDGADCIALTHETAIGKFPNRTVELVNHVVREADASTHQKYHLCSIGERLPLTMDPKIAVAMAACTVAEKVRAPAIIVLTTSGKSAKLISWFRPRAAVIAITAYERTARQLNFWRVVVPVHNEIPCGVDWFMDIEKKFQLGIANGKESGFIRAGDPVVLVSGYGKDVGFTNCVRVVYASPEPDVYKEHSREFYSNAILGDGPRYDFPYIPCKQTPAASPKGHKKKFSRKKTQDSRDISSGQTLP